MNLKQQTIATYNKSAQAFIDEFNGLGARKSDIELAFSYIKKDSPMVLELGCGHGRDATEILKRTNNYTGIDVSVGFIKEAQRLNPQGKFLIADMEEYEMPKDLDIIFAFASLLHSDKNQVEKLIQKAANSLNTGGIFFISLKYDNYHQSTKTEEEGTRTYYYYTPEEIEKLSPSNLKNIFQDFQDVRGQRWFTIILQKQ